MQHPLKRLGRRQRQVGKDRRREGIKRGRGRRRETDKEPPCEPNLPQILDSPNKLVHATGC